MSTQTNANTLSRLAQIQAKFQQKQLNEREKRKLELTAKAKAETNTEPTSTTRTMGNGKVRQMFDARRGAGIDRSNPLKPITARSTNSGVKSPETKNINGLTSANIRRQSALGFEHKNNSTKDLINLNKNLNKLNLRDTSHKAQSYEDLMNNNTTTMKNAASVGKGKNEVPLKPVVVKKTPTKKSTPTNVTDGHSIKASPLTSSKKSLVPSTTSTASSLSSKTSGTKITLSIKPPPRIVTPPPGMATCKFCSRNFNSDRLEKHEEVCKKMNVKKRKIFDATKQRVKGTEAEVYVKKTMRGGAVAPVRPTTTSNKKSDWRQKHEDFIAAIRNAKKVQAYLAKGGKVSDLPPPPVSSNPDYIQCPHCSRRFNQGAAERHIPKCATMRHNKPKPAARKN